MLKFGGDPIVKTLNTFYNIFLDTGVFPKTWKTGRIVLIPKSKAKIVDISNLRPISLLSNIFKIFEMIILKRLNEQNMIEKIINKTQTGFKPGKGTDWNLAIIADHLHRARTKRKTKAILFVDLSRAYDTVN